MTKGYHWHMVKYSAILFTIMFLLLTGCNLNSASLPTATPPATVPYVRIAQVSTPVPPATREMRPVPTQTTVPMPTITQTPRYTCEASDDAASIRHDVTASLDYATHSAQVSQRTRFINRTFAELTEVVFNVEANSHPGGFELESLLLNGVQPPLAIERNRLTVQLPQPLSPGCEIVFNLTFQVMTPRIATTLTGFKGYFGYNERQWNLSLWLPTIAAHIGSTWLVHPPSPIGEQTVLPAADWDVTIILENAPEGVRIAAPGLTTRPDANQWRFRLSGGRDFSMSLSPHYRIAQQVLESGVTVELYSFPDAVRPTRDGNQDAAEHALREAVRAFEQYESLFGPYPYQRMVIVQGDFPDGMEFTGLVYVSTAWFYDWDGGVTNFLTVITVHEVSHQWWYARVGNDAAYAPWLDEALATYSEYIYFEEFFPELKNWWWDFRVGWYNPQGAVDSDIYAFRNARDYINAVYLRGVQMLHNLREDIGTQAFFDLLAEYAVAGDGQIATPQVFWSLLDDEQWSLTRDTRGQFLNEPDLLGRDVTSPADAGVDDSLSGGG